MLKKSLYIEANTGVDCRGGAVLSPDVKIWILSITIGR